MGKNRYSEIRRELIFLFFFFSSRRRHTRSVSAFLLNRSSDLRSDVMSKGKKRSGARPGRPQPLRGTKGKRKGARSEERFSRNAETDLVCRLLLEKKNIAEQLERIGLEVARFKTGTPPRVDGRTVNYSGLQPHD